MPVEIGGQSVLGIAFETVVGTYVSPTKWIPYQSETLQKVESKRYRMNLRGIADRTSGPQSYFHVEGDVSFEVTDDVLPYFLYMGRFTPAKATGPPIVYTFTPAHIARPSTAASGPTNRRTASILVHRGGTNFGYVGMSVTQYAFSYDDGVLVCTVSLLGMDETTQTLGAQTWPTTGPFGPAHNTIEIPTATVRLDTDTVAFTINDNGSVEQRMDGTRAATFLRWGEREVTLSAEIDFDGRTDYDAFLNQTNQTISVKHSQGANNKVEFVFNATVQDSFVVNASGLGDLIRSSVEYHGVYGSMEPVTVTVTTSESIT